MKNIVTVLIFTLSTSALAAPMLDAEGTYHAAPPPRFEGGGIVATVTPDWLIANEGWSYATPERIAQEEAALEEQRAAEAQYADPEPALFAPRFRGPITNVVGLSQILVDDETGLPVALDETGSPEHTTKQKDDQHAAAKSARAAAKAAIEDAAKNGKVNARLDAIEAALKTLLK